MKINLKKYLIVLLGALVLSSCSTDKTMIAKGVDLNKYGYASIVKGQTIHGTETDIEIEPGIYEAIESTRLKMVGERRVNDLTEEQKETLILVKYAATSDEAKSTLSISFEDYMTGKTVASCRSSNRFALTRQKDVDRAINKLAKRIKGIWK
ncbi:MAG: hypothetical protein IKO23_08570 [Bacteroidales bacterium]|nr:hypothetical protein [Bacteroidales bacterium]